MKWDTSGGPKEAEKKIEAKVEEGDDGWDHVCHGKGGLGKSLSTLSLSGFFRSQPHISCPVLSRWRETRSNEM